RAIDMRVMALVGLILDVRGRNGDPARLLFRRLVDLVIGGERRAALFSEHFGDRRRQRRLALADVSHRPDVAMGLVPLEFFFGHGTLRSDPSGILVLTQIFSALRPTRSPAVPSSDRIA